MLTILQLTGTHIAPNLPNFNKIRQCVTELLMTQKILQARFCGWQIEAKISTFLPAPRKIRGVVGEMFE